MMKFAMLYLKFPPILAGEEVFVAPGFMALVDIRQPGFNTQGLYRVVPDLISNARADGDPELQVAKGVA